MPAVQCWQGYVLRGINRNKKGAPLAHLFCFLQADGLLKMAGDLVHPGLLLNSERTPAFAVTAVKAIVGIYRKLGVVVGGNFISCQSKIVILVDKTDVDPCWTGLAMVAVYADAGNGLSSKAGNHGIVLLRVGSFREVKELIQMCHGHDTGNNSQNTGAIYGVLQALCVGQCYMERGLTGIQKLTGKEGLHYRNADTFLLTPLEQIKPFFYTADTVLVALLKVICRIDGEHHHIHKSRV